MHPEPHDHYATLGIPTTATPAQITHAYRSLVRGLHPDTTTLSGDTSVSFTAVTAAYRILHDPARRADYDRSRHAPAATRTSDPSEIHTTVHVTVQAPCPGDVTPTAAPPHPATHAPLLRVGPVRTSPVP